MFYLSEIHYEDDPIEMSARFERGLRTAVRLAARYWKVTFAPKHFRPSAVREYDYQLRTKEYQIRKARKMHHQDPLVWTGRLRTMVLGQFPEPRVSDTGSVMKSAMSLEVPRYTYYTTTKSGSASPRKYDELIRLSQQEADVLQGILLTEITKSMRRKKRAVVRVV